MAKVLPKSKNPIDPKLGDVPFRQYAATWLAQHPGAVNSKRISPPVRIRCTGRGSTRYGRVAYLGHQSVDMTYRVLLALHSVQSGDGQERARRPMERRLSPPKVKGRPS